MLIAYDIKQYSLVISYHINYPTIDSPGPTVIGGHWF